MDKEWTYAEAGVDIGEADQAKRLMAVDLQTEDERLLSGPGAFAALFAARFPGIEDPVLVLKAEEPGSKQQLAFQAGKVANICRDLIHHLINDIVVMGARPEVVLDTILCGKMEKATVVEIVRELAAACREQGCRLVGGETSVQPRVLPDGAYMLNATIVGVVDRAHILDGRAIRPGDVVLAIASNGLHTNGYTLVRRLLEEQPELAETQVGGETFFEAILRPHLCYYLPLKEVLTDPGLHGLAHITGGGIEGNLNRILPEGTDARIDTRRLRVPPLFRLIQERGRVPEREMLRTFNMGVGMTVVAAPEAVPHLTRHLERYGCETYPIGDIAAGGDRKVRFL